MRDEITKRAVDGMVLVGVLRLIITAIALYELCERRGRPPSVKQ